MGAASGGFTVVALLVAALDVGGAGRAAHVVALVIRQAGRPGVTVPQPQAWLHTHPVGLPQVTAVAGPALGILAACGAQHGRVPARRAAAGGGGPIARRGGGTRSQPQHQRCNAGVEQRGELSLHAMPHVMRQEMPSCARVHARGPRRFQTRSFFLPACSLANVLATRAMSANGMGWLSGNLRFPFSPQKGASVLSSALSWRTGG